VRHISVLWKANFIAFISSFCVMVIELIASRILAPYIGVSLYTWTSIIGIILAGIALGNYIGGKLADRYASSHVLMAIFFAGSLMTIAILPSTKLVASSELFSNLPMMVAFVLKTTCIFFVPAIILSMVSPLVIKLTLADLGKTGGVVGTIYACSTAGAILGTFMTGFYLILWFGTRMIVWWIAAVLIFTGILAWFSWNVPDRWRASLKNILIWIAIIAVMAVYVSLFQIRESWQEDYTMESNYYTIRVYDIEDNVKVLSLDYLIHSYNKPGEPTFLKYTYLQIFDEIVRYATRDNPAPRVLHLGGGGYSFPQYLEAVYPDSVNEVVEIDPAVTQVAYQELGLPRDTGIRTYNLDARLFLMQRPATDKYDFVIGDVFNDLSTPYHLTTLEFDRLVKANLNEGGIYLMNIIDDYKYGKFMPAMLYTLNRVFDHVYPLGYTDSWEYAGPSTYVIAATDRQIDLADYIAFITRGGKRPVGIVRDEAKLERYLAEREPILLADDHAPTDILVLPLMDKLYKQRQAGR
jgi:spermidine synthase